MAILQNEVINYLLGLIEQSGHDAPLPSQNELRQKFACSTVTVRKALEKLEKHFSFKKTNKKNKKINLKFKKLNTK